MYHHEIDCCNGLSLCEGTYGSRYVVVNLATRQRFSIPEPLLDIFSSEIGKWVRHIVPGDWVEHLSIREFGTVSAEVIKVPCGATGYGLIGHSRGILYYVNYDKEFRSSMWQLDYQSTSASIWVMRHSICTNDMLDKNPGILHTMKLKNRRCGRLYEPFSIHLFSDIIFLGLQGRVYSYHLESHKYEHFWWTTRCMDWRYDFVYPVSYNYVNVKDFHKADLFLQVSKVSLANELRATSCCFNMSFYADHVYHHMS
ncbi:hypothetical protein MKX03_032162 [Papaver bracteatum]|nr:hypothetical protein MKX03_032162 [Papaver bracteatum]